jgi:cytidine deaminase
MNWEPLVAAAVAARARAYAPYSGFPVGSALLFADGSIVAGSNVENASSGLTLCAERVALFAGVSAGRGRPVAVVVVAEANRPVPPCGSCLQALSEFAGPELPILLLMPNGRRDETRLGDLLPQPFAFDRVS